MSTTREDALERRAFAERFARALREGDRATVDEITARHRALGYGGPVAPHVDAISACVPGPQVPGPYVRCVCGQEMPASTWLRHVELAPTSQGIHRYCLRSIGLDVETAPRIIEGELPAADDESDELPAWLFGAAS